jgi:hypothetical protein
MDNQLNKFVVEYHTKPSPALSYYEGYVTVYAEDYEQAEERARRELIRKSPEYRNSIVITNVSLKI